MQVKREEDDQVKYQIIPNDNEKSFLTIFNQYLNSEVKVIKHYAEWALKDETFKRVSENLPGMRCLK